MNLRDFFKTAILSVGAIAFWKPKRQYFSEVEWEKIVGLRFEAENQEWIVIAECPDTFKWQGEMFSNQRKNKFLAHCLNSKRMELICLHHVILNRMTLESEHKYELADLRGLKFYKA